MTIVFIIIEGFTLTRRTKKQERKNGKSFLAFYKKADFQARS